MGLENSAGSRIWSRRRASIGTACRLETSQGCLRRITNSGAPSRHSPSGMSASAEMPRPVGMWSVDMQRVETPPAAVATHATNCDHTTPRGSAGLSSWPGWVRSFRSSALGCGGDIRLIAFITEPGLIRKILAPLVHSIHPGSRTTRRTRPPPTSVREYTPARSADRHRPEAH